MLVLLIIILITTTTTITIIVATTIIGGPGLAKVTDDIFNSFLQKYVQELKMHLNHNNHTVTL